MSTAKVTPTVTKDPKPAAPKPTTAKEAENTRVKQGTENAPPAKPSDTSPFTTKNEDSNDKVVVRGADGQDIEVNPEAQNTTQTLENAKAIDENPATKALREQQERAALAGLVQNDALVTAAEQTTQRAYLEDKGLVDAEKDARAAGVDTSKGDKK